MSKFWVGTVPEVDDFEDAIDDEFIDGNTKYGLWAIMTPRSFKEHGVGLGTGRGQRYKKNVNDHWVQQ